MKFKLAVVTSHPIQYQAPLFRKLSMDPDIDLTVYFCRDFGIGKEQHDPGFNRKIKWDIPLIEGYRYQFLTNWSLKPSSKFFGQINPSIMKELVTIRYNAILVHGYASFSRLLAFGVAFLSKTPIIFRGDSHLLDYRPAWKKCLKKLILSKLFKRISAFLSIGTLNAEYYKHYGVPGNKMFHSPYAVDNDFFSGKYEILRNERERIKAKLGIVSDMPVILYVSKMTPRKRAGDLLAAFKQVQDKVYAALVMVGDGQERPFLETYAKKNNLNNVYFTGFKNQTELPEFYSVADIFVLPSRDEPWGLVINEAMNFELPIITTNQVGAAPDLVKHGENGFIYSAGDIEILANYLLVLLKESDLTAKMGRRSQEIISKWSFNEDIEGILSSLEYLKGHNG